MFTNDDIQTFITPNHNRNLGGYASAAWVDTLGQVHHVDWHANLCTEVNGERVRGCDAFQHGWLKVYVQPSAVKQTNEFGFQSRRLLNDVQVDFCIAACEALNADSVVGVVADKNILHDVGDGTGESAAEHLRKNLPHS